MSEHKTILNGKILDEFILFFSDVTTSTPGVTDSVTDGVTNDVTNGVTDGVTGGVTNGVTGNVSNGVTNGGTTGYEVCFYSKVPMNE